MKNKPAIIALIVWFVLISFIIFISLGVLRMLNGEKPPQPDLIATLYCNDHPEDDSHCTCTKYHYPLIPRLTEETDDIVIRDIGYLDRLPGGHFCYNRKRSLGDTNHVYSHDNREYVVNYVHTEDCTFMKLLNVTILNFKCSIPCNFENKDSCLIPCENPNVNLSLFTVSQSGSDIQNEYGRLQDYSVGVFRQKEFNTDYKYRVTYLVNVTTNYFENVGDYCLEAKSK